MPNCMLNYIWVRFVWKGSCAHTHTHTYTCVRVCVCVYGTTTMCVFEFVHGSVQVSVCVCVCVCVSVCEYSSNFRGSESKGYWGLLSLIKPQRGTSSSWLMAVCVHTSVCTCMHVYIPLLHSVCSCTFLVLKFVFIKMCVCVSGCVYSNHVHGPVHSKALQQKIAYMTVMREY